MATLARHSLVTYRLPVWSRRPLANAGSRFCTGQSRRSTTSNLSLPLSATRPFSNKRALEPNSGEAGLDKDAKSNAYSGGFYPPQQSSLRDAALTTFMGIGMSE
jgi:hypothetical protein